MTYTKLCRLAQCEVLSLISEGYFVVFEWKNRAKESWYVALHHRRNGNRAMVRVNMDGAVLMINGEVSKVIA